MTGSVVHLGSALRVGTRQASAIAVVLLLAAAFATAQATRSGMLPIAIAGVLAVVATIVGFRWPLVLLVVFAALIPIEEVIVIQGLGTLSRVAGILFAVTYALPRIGSLRLTALPVAGWAYAGWALASFAWAIGPDAASPALVTLVQLFLIALFAADFVVRRPSIVRPILWAYSASATATAVIGVASYIGRGLGTERSAALADQNPAQFATVLLPAFVFGLYEFIHGERRALGGVVAILTAAGVVVSGTRGAWLACVVVVLFVVLPQLSARRRLIAIVTIVAMSAAVYQVPGVAELLADRAGDALSSGGAGRTDIWKVALAIFNDSPVAGVGYANFPVAFTTQVIREVGLGWEWLARPGTGSHNVIVANAVELGGVGLVLLGLFVGPLLIRRGWGAEARIVQAGLIALFTSALFLDILSNRKQIWLFIALAAGLAYVDRRERRPVAEEPRADPPSGAAERDLVAG